MAGGGGGASGDVNYPDGSVTQWQEAIQAIRNVTLDGADGFNNPWSGQAFSLAPNAVFGTGDLPYNIVTDLLALDFTDMMARRYPGAPYHLLVVNRRHQWLDPWFMPNVTKVNVRFAPDWDARNKTYDDLWKNGLSRFNIQPKELP